MVSFEARMPPRTAFGSLLLATLAVPCMAVAQPEPAPGSDDALREIAARLEDVETRAGTSSPDLIAPLTGLALVYRERGDDALAAATLERARQLVRVNYGLYSMEEASLLRQQVPLARARGDAEAAWALEQQLLALVERHPDDPRTAPILREIAGQRMDVLRRYHAGEFPPEIVLGCYYVEREYARGFRSCHSGSRSVVVHSLLSEAREYYAAADEFILERERADPAACDDTPVREVLDDANAPNRELRYATLDTLRYLRAMSAYLDCVQARPARDAGSDASSRQSSPAATARPQDVKDVYEEQIALVVDLAD